MVREDHQNNESEQGIVSRRDYLRAGLVTAGIAASPIALTEGVGTARAAPAPVPDPSPVDSLIGGGQQYDRKVSGGDYTVTTKNQLIDRLSSANSGETVYIPNDVSIDIGTTKKISISSGVTLASGRGINGASGGRLYTEDIAEDNKPVFKVRGDNVRITGLRMQGPRPDYFNPGKCEGQTGIHCRDGEAMDKYATMGFLIMGSGGEVDNCQMYGWPQVPLMTGAYGGYAVNTHIHHNSLHNNQMEGYGYGVRVTVGNPIIEWNYFDKNRHSIAASGEPECSYEARYNLVGPHPVSHAFDMHGEEEGVIDGGQRAGNTMYVHHNTFQFEESYIYGIGANPGETEDTNGYGQEAVTVRGVPKDQALLENNWFYHGQKPDDVNVSENGQAFRQYHIPQDEWTNFEFNNNHYGRSEPPSNIGHPRSGDGDDGGNDNGGGNESLAAEIGTVSKDADTWKSVSFDGSYNDPVVVMKPVSQFNGKNPCHARVRNVTGSGFEYQLEEWPYTPNGHRPETISYLVMEQGTGMTSDGTHLEAGTIATDESFSEVTFDTNFDEQPVVFTQTQTVNGSNAVVTRNTHVDATDFEVRLQEQNARTSDNSGHLNEVTAYIAIEPGVTTLSGSEVEVGRQSSVTDNWTRLGFGGSYSTPGFVADMQTTNDGDTATLRYKDLDSTGVDIQVEEEQSGDTETEHRAETVGYLVTSSGGGRGGDSVGEIGTVSQNADTWQSVPFANSYNNPVVVMKPVSQFNGENPCHARVKNVTSSGFEYQLEEWPYTPNGHRPETISYLVMEQGTHTTSDGTRIDVGTTTTDEHFTNVTLQNIRQTPVVFTQTQTMNGPNAVVTRNTHVDATDFEVRLQEQNARSSDTSGHLDESVGYIAIEPGSVNFGTKTVEIGRQSNVTDSWTRLGFSRNHSTPGFVADMQTTNDGDTATLRYKDLDSTGVDIQVEEEQSGDIETNHRGETVGYFVTSGNGPL